MLRRRLLKRLTRLGLATYAMTWCMTFTVCASENPVADIMVADTAGLIVESSDTGSDTTILTEGDTGIVPADEDPVDAPADEAIIVGDDESDIIITDDTPAVSDDIITELTEDAVADEDMVIGTFDDEEFSEPDGGPTTPQIDFFERLRIENENEVSISARGNYTYSITGQRTRNYHSGWNETLSDLDPGKISWGLFDGDELGELQGQIINSTIMSQKLHGVTINPDGLNVSVSFEKAEPHAEFFLVAAYYNGEEFTDTYEYAEGYLPITVDMIGGSEDLEAMEAHVAQSSLKVEMYKKRNVLPVSIRMSDVDRSEEMPLFNITEVKFGSAMLNNYFNISANPVKEEHFNIVITAKEEVVNDDALVDMLKSYKKGISTNLKLNVTSGGNSTILTTKEKVKFTFGDEKPTSKTVKSNAMLKFDCWMPGNNWYRVPEGLNITGANVTRIAIPENDKKTWSKQGFVLTVDPEYGYQVIESNSNMTKKGSGKLNVVAVLGDDFTYNLPDDYNITIPINYSITDGTPTFTFDKSSVTLNKNATDATLIKCTVKSKGSSSVRSYVNVTVKDSKGKVTYDESNTPINVSVSSWTVNSDFEIKLNTTEFANFSTSYKVRVKLVSVRDTNITTAYKDITVKVLSKKDSANMGISSISATGSLDAIIPYSSFNLTVKGKNVNLCGTDPESITFTLKNGSVIDIPHYDGSIFYGSEGDYKNNARIITIRQRSPFYLLSGGYGGQDVIANITFNINGERLSKTYSFKIKESTITPKLDRTKFTMNPDYDNDSISFYVSSQMSSYCYHKIEFFDGKENASDKFDIIYDYRGSEMVKPKNLTQMAGKTYTMKVTPYSTNYNLSAKTATAKIVIQKKNTAVIMSAQTTGTIDPVRSNTYAITNLTFKNILNPHLELKEIRVLSIKHNKRKTNVMDKFEIWPGSYTNPIVTFRYNGTEIEDGTYKVTIEAEFKNGKTVTTDTDFKVVRGKTNTKLNPTSVTLVNRDYTRSYILDIGSADYVNDITNVVFDDAYKDVFTFSKQGNNRCWRVKLRYGYVERTKKGDPISKAVKKTVPINVYYNGSTKPDTVKLTVTIDP